MSEKTQWVGPTILVCKKVLKGGTMTQILDHVNKKGDDFWENSFHEDEESGEPIEDKYTQIGSESKLLNKVYEAIDDNINGCVEEYINKFKHYGSYITRKEEYNLVRYRKGASQEEHVDILPIEDEEEEEEEDEEREVEILASSSRKLSVMIFLNDDYEGGNIRFPYQKVDYKPTKGDVLVFDCGALHPYSCDKITKGKKYVINTWMY